MSESVDPQEAVERARGWEWTCRRVDLPPALRYLMSDVDAEAIIGFAREFCLNFKLGVPEEVDLESWRHLERTNGKGWVAICAYIEFMTYTNLFDGNSGMAFLTYVYARCGRGYPPGVQPTILTRMASLLSERASRELVTQNNILDIMRGVREKV